MENKRKAFFLGVSNDERNNKSYSNFVYSLCYFCIKQVYPSYEFSDFNRHDMLMSDNIKYSVYRCITDFDLLIVLLDETPIDYKSSNGKIETHRMYNPNVWFELGIAASHLDKSIILLSRDNDNPFYAKDVQPCVITPTIEKKYFSENIDFFNYSQIDDKIKEIWYKRWCEIYEKKSDEHDELKRLMDFIKSKIKIAKNPFINEAFRRNIIFGTVWIQR